jgi:predicted nucleic acid-binding protein
MILLDTDVLVECLRGSSAAKEWLSLNANEAFRIPGVAAMELLAACHNRNDLARTQTFLAVFKILWPDSVEFLQAYELLATHRLASGIGIPDCLIAASAIRHNARLFTFNLKHFQIIAGLDVQQPTCVRDSEEAWALRIPSPQGQSRPPS